MKTVQVGYERFYGLTVTTATDELTVGEIVSYKPFGNESDKIAYAVVGEKISEGKPYTALGNGSTYEECFANRFTACIRTYRATEYTK